MSEASAARQRRPDLDFAGTAAFVIALSIVAFLSIVGRHPSAGRITSITASDLIALGGTAFALAGDYSVFEYFLIAAGCALMLLAVLLPDLHRVFDFCRRFRREETSSQENERIRSEDEPS